MKRFTTRRRENRENPRHPLLNLKVIIIYISASFSEYKCYTLLEIDSKKLMEETIKKHEAFQFLVKKRAANTERKISRFENLIQSAETPDLKTGLIL